MASRIVRWRGSLPRRIALSRPNRSSSRWAISTTPMRAGPGRGELDGERDPVEAPADLHDQPGRCIVEDEGRIGGACPSDEERDRRDGHRGLARDLRLGRRRRQRLDRPHLLAGHRQRLPARGDDRHLRRFAQDPAHQRGHRFDEVLAVVEQQQAVAGTEHLDDRVVDRAAPPEVDVDRGGERGGRWPPRRPRSRARPRGRRPSSWPPPCGRARDRARSCRPHPGPTSVMRRCSASASTSSARSASRPINGWIAVSQPGDRRHGDGSGAATGAGHGLDRGDELVALAVDRADDRLPVAVVVDGLANRLDAGGERRLADEAIAPDLVEQLLLADDGAAALHQVRRGRRRPSARA